ncbi:choice-of-anchor Q domain-containing protein [Flagellimonas sp. 2504JD4-2]
MKCSLVKSSALLSLLVLAISWSSCRKDFDYVPSSGNLQFSKDTVFLDTIFTNIGSATYTLKVYNRSSEDVLIPFVGLETGQSSSYRLNVDGQAGKEFNDVPLLAKDSLFVFIETTFDVSQTPENEFLYTEGLLFGSGDSQQTVELVTLVKDAVFLYPATLSNGTKETLVLGLDENGNEIRVEGFYMEPGELQFTNEKPYVIYGYAAVPEGNTLTVDAGARVHFHNNSGLLVSSGSSLHVNGLLSDDPELLENEVIFEGDRLEPTYADVPGQWGTVWLREGSIDNQINHLTLKNATIGLRAEGDGVLSNPILTLRNSQISNSVSNNIWAITSYIVAENSVLGGSGSSSFYGNNGGKYRFTHCTLANYWNNGIRTWPTLALDNFSTNSTQALEEATFINCIVDGSMRLELSFQRDSGADFNISFENSMIQFNDSDNQFEGNPLYDFSDTGLYQNIVLNEDADFTAPFQDQFTIGENSAAINAANPNIIPAIPIDILGNDRSPNPDIGAYEFVIEN